MKKTKKKSTRRSTYLKRIAKRLAAYSAAAAATVMTSQDRSAEAEEVIWDIPDVAISGLGINFNMLSGGVTTATKSWSYGDPILGSFRVGSAFFPGYIELAGPWNSDGVGFVSPDGFGAAYKYASLLGPGSSVGPDKDFGGRTDFPYYGIYVFLSDSLGRGFIGTRGFVGLQFDVGGSTLYGWADISGFGDGTLHAFGFNDSPGTPSVTPSDSEITGDFNGDSNYDLADVDPLVADIAAGDNTASFDLTGDGLVDTADLASWLAEAGAANLGPGLSYLPGDADLSGDVNAADLNQVGLNWLRQVAAWSAGDFTADGTVDAADLNQLGINWQMTSVAQAAVPEPHGLILLAAGAAGLGLWRRRRAGKAT